MDHPAGPEERERSAPTRSSLRAQDLAILAVLGLLVFATVALAAYTTALQQRTAAVGAETTALISPGVRATQELIVAVSLEEELLGEPGATAELERQLAVRTSAMERLQAISGAFGEDASALFRSLAGSMREWDSITAAVRGSGVPVTSDEALDREIPSLFRTILRDGTELQRILYGEIERARDELDSAERLDWYYTLGIALLALTTAVVVFVLVRRIRQLAQISERRRLQAESAVADRARLIRGITHDLKNPLGAADGSAQLLEMGIVGELTAAQLEMVARVRRGIGSALGIVSDLLELSRAEGHALPIHLAPCDVGALLLEIADDYRSQSERAGIVLSTDIPPDLPALTTDAKRVREIVGNLLSNALKFTPSGGSVLLAAGLPSSAAAPAALEIRVTDNGPGIAPEEQERVFEEFYRAGTAGSRPAGTGLGLTISRRLARLLGGDLRLRSEPGRGSTFTFVLPLREASTAAAPGS